MGGVCGVTSRLGIGSNFWFSICVTPGSRASLRSGTVGPIELAGTAALVADDDATTRRDASRMLQDLGVDPSSANSGFEALAALRNARESGQPYTVAFISPSMDGMDCLDVQAEIEEVARDRTHIIALTPRGAPASLSEVASKISRIALSTPVRPNEFLDSLRAALGGETPGSPVGDSLPPTDWLADEQEIGLLLLAEDNLVNQKVAVAMLTSAGFRVDTVLDGAAAVKAARDRHYDTILMDCQMPEMSGYEATAAIRTQEGSEGHTPIIALTAGARDEDRLRCLAEGMDAYLSKPFKRYALISLVRQFTPRRMGAALDADNDP
jgi:CheY-like chemotaxis protein